MRYNKEDAQMTQGLAVLCMVILHLFCRTGSDVLGTPLIWLNATTPLVYWFGFFAEICYIAKILLQRDVKVVCLKAVEGYTYIAQVVV